MLNQSLFLSNANLAGSSTFGKCEPPPPPIIKSLQPSRFFLSSPSQHLDFPDLLSAATSRLLIPRLNFPNQYFPHHPTDRSIEYISPAKRKSFAIVGIITSIKKSDVTSITYVRVNPILQSDTICEQLSDN